MSLRPGTRLGSYEVLSELGAGGMGEVYRARDNKLGRDVAIKVLPDELSRDQERLDRFEREARLLAQLNHTNIATLYGFEDGYIILELVEGETLADRIARGPMPLEDAVALFTAIAEGLAAAHNKGVVHRDLKPANIKIDPDGTPKILDFGLAKAFAPERDVSAEASQSPTLTKGTALGAIMGTASYMSPEQARGKTVDKRTDIWAFGCCLYESLTGKKPFAGDTVTDVLAAVVQNEPDYTAVPAQTRKLLRRCLAKTKTERYHDIADVRLDLGDIGQAPEPVSVRRPGWISFAAATLVAALAGFLLRPSDREQPPRVRRVAVPTAPAAEVGVFPSEYPQPTLALSPDGTTLVFVGLEDGVHRLYVRKLNESTATPLAGTEDARYPFFSPDGSWVGFDANDRLQKVPVKGGTPTVLCRVDALVSARWAEPNWIDFIDFGGAILRVASDGGEPSTTSDIARFSGLAVLPDERGLVVSQKGNIYLLDAQSGATRELLEDGSRPTVLTNGFLLFVRGLDLMAARFDARRGELRGDAVATGLELEGDGVNFAIANDGTLAYVPADVTQRRLVRVDRNGRPSPLTGVERGFGQGPRLSPNGSQVAVYINELGSPEVHLLDIERDTLSRLTFSGAFQPTWSPAGDFVYFPSARTGVRTLFRRRSDGSGEAESLAVTGVFPSSITPDGAALVVHERRERSGWDIGVVLLEDPPRTETLLTGSYDEHSGMISPNGRWLAYVSDEDGRDAVYVQAFPELGQKRKVSTGGGREPRWSRDGTELFYRDGDAMLSVVVRTGAGLEMDPPRVLFERRYQRSGDYDTYYDVSLDGSHFIMVEDEPVREVSIIFGFFEELERLLPATP